MPGSGRFTTHIQHVGAFAHHAEALRDRRLRVSAQTVATERVRRDIDDSHHIGASAPFEAAGTDFRDHEPIILRLDMKLADLARGAGAVLEGNGEVEVTGIEVDNVSGQTTTEAPEVQAWLARMVEAGAACAVLETTSHALVQERVHACDFDVAAFTNVGHDHLDYHATWEEYLEAKARLIDLTSRAADKGVEKTAVLNRDDPSYERLAGRPISRRWTYGFTTAADLHPLDLAITGSGSRFRMKTPVGETEVALNVPARFNIYNALCAAGVCLALGVEVDDVGRGLAGFEGVRGRLEPVDLGQDFRVYIDFAHAAGSLACALAELRPFTPGRLLAVCGSSARSDHDRPGMGRAAAEFSDFFIITTDDPLSEDPAEIARDVQAGAEGKAPGRDFEVVIDRRAAIRRAIEVAQTGDTVLLAGKGHERSMRTARGSEPWDERAEAEEAIKERL